jgi:hypothetical protein
MFLIPRCFFLAVYIYLSLLKRYAKSAETTEFIVSTATSTSQAFPNQGKRRPVVGIEVLFHYQ